MLHQNFIIIGTLIGAIGSVAYLIDTIKGNPFCKLINRRNCEYQNFIFC